MKKLAIALVISSFSMSFATYQVVYPNQLVNFKSTGNQTSPETPEVPEIPEVPETFTPTDPLISEWTSINDPYDCGTYMPDTSSYAYGVVFNQTSENCKIDQERTIQNRQISSITNQVSNIGEPTVENQTLTDQHNSIEATGSRYNYTMTVGHYKNGPYDYYGYFSDGYMATHGAGFTTVVRPTFNTNTFRGSSIDHLMESGGTVTMRVLPDITGTMPVITINGKPCTLTGPSIYTAYDGICNFNLDNYVGQIIYIDLR
jgi:hypothetical protein